MNNKETNFISAVVYVHNQEKNISTFLQRLYTILNDNFNKYEIICVNDASTDNSSDVIHTISNTFSNTAVTILHMSYFHGTELSMNAGVDLSIGDFVLEFDSIIMDYESSFIMNIYQTALSGSDIVSASPANKQRMTSRLFYKVFNHFTIANYHIQTETFRILSRRVINRVSAMNKTIPYRKAIYANCGLSTKVISYTSVSTSDRENSSNRHYRFSLAVDSLILFTELGYRFSIWMTFLMMGIAFLVAIYTVIIFLTGVPVEGWTTTMLFLSFAFFGLFGILTIIIKYLSILIDLTFKKQQYRISSIEKISK